MQTPQKPQTPQNIKQLRDDLLDAYNMLKLDPKRYNQVGELANTAGKIIQTVKLELEYCGMRGEEPNIDFLEYGQQRLKTEAVKVIESGKAA